MKQPSFPLIWPKIALILFLLPSCSASEDCSVEVITTQENSIDKINNNFECIEKRLSDIDNKLEQILSRLSEKPKIGGNDQRDPWSATIGSAEITITKTTLKNLPNGIQLVAEWRVRNQSDKNIMIMLSYGKDTTIRLTGDKGRYAKIAGISICKKSADRCASWDSSKWSIIPPGQIHGFSTSIVSRGIKMSAPSLSVNARFILNDQDNVMVRDISFSDIEISP